LALQFLSLKGASAIIIDLTQKRRCFRRPVVHFVKHKIVESSAKSRARIKMTAGHENHTVHIAEPNLAFVEFVKKAHV
jgi:hypothetical protein